VSFYKAKNSNYKQRGMSIYLKKDYDNKFVLTLSEFSSLSNPNYLFVFENIYNKESNPIYYTTPDLSSYKSRYNLFQLIESSTGSTTGGTSVSLSLMSGQYDYLVYESSASTLSISATTGIILESGRMVVDDENGNYTDEIIPTQNNNSPSIYD
jgi:hypothetical protein